MYNVWLLSPIIGNGTSVNRYRPQFTDDYPLYTWTDDTGRPVGSYVGQPNQIILLVTCDAAQLATIEADSRYYIVATEEISDETA